MHHVAVYTEQWLGYIFFTLEGFTLLLFRRGVFWCLLYEESLLCQNNKILGCSSVIIRITPWKPLTSLQNTPFLILFQRRESDRWNGVLVGRCWWQEKDWRKQSLEKLARNNKTQFASTWNPSAYHATECMAPCYLYPVFVPFTWWHLQWSHIYRTPCLAVAPWAKTTMLSANELWLIFPFFQYPLSYSLMKDDVLNNSTVTSLGKVPQHLWSSLV